MKCGELRPKMRWVGKCGVVRIMCEMRVIIFLVKCGLCSNAGSCWFENAAGYFRMQGDGKCGEFLAWLWVFSECGGLMALYRVSFHKSDMAGFKCGEL